MESLHCFYVFGWIKLKFGVRGNFRLLISNLNRKSLYQFEILRKCYFSSWSWFLAQHSLINWLPYQQWMTSLHSFNSKRYYRWLPKTDISLVKISWTVFKTFSKASNDVMNFFCQFVMTFTYSISLSRFIMIWLGTAKLGG